MKSTILVFVVLIIQEAFSNVWIFDLLHRMKRQTTYNCQGNTNCGQTFNGPINGAINIGGYNIGTLNKNNNNEFNNGNVFKMSGGTMNGGTFNLGGSNSGTGGSNSNAGRVDCQWSKWGQWEKCVGHCGIGRKVRRRTISTGAKNGGTPCYGSDVSEEPCQLPPCEKVKVDVANTIIGQANVKQTNKNADVTNTVHNKDQVNFGNPQPVQSYGNQNNQNYGNQNNQQPPNFANQNGQQGNFGNQYNPDFGNQNYQQVPNYGLYPPYHGW